MADPPDIKAYPYLAPLNAAQLRAVMAPPSRPLQILAGPGSGKTRVLTARVAHLVRCHEYSPREIVAVTFTNKAAAEMRARLGVLLGLEANQLVLGTFHATCVKYLRKHGMKIGLSNNFAIADQDDCKKIMSKLLKERKEHLAAQHIQLKEGAVLSEISKAKSKGETPDGMAMRAAQPRARAGGFVNGTAESGDHVLSIIAELYGEYQAALHEAGALDFDDLLLYGLRLATAYPAMLSSCRHILVDEFQDTNTTQYDLMRCFAAAHGGLTIVGDPDQSIYGWRSAEVENLDHMVRDFKDVDAIYLEENYRSTGAILAASHSIVSQDTKRIQKGLFTSHPDAHPIPLKLFTSTDIEADFIAAEIKRVVAYSGEMLDYNDFAILLRYNALSREIEGALQRAGIPSRVIGGHKFFERMEVKDVLAYLQLADNPNFTPAFVRVVNVPKRSIGDKSVKDIIDAAKKKKVSPMELCEDAVDGGPVPDGLRTVMKKVGKFVSIIRKIRRAALQDMSVDGLIRLILDETDYMDHLQRTQPDYEARQQNVEELISFSVSVEENREKMRQQYAADADADGEPGFSSARSALSESKGKAKPAAVEEPRVHPMFRKRGSDASASASGPSSRASSAPPRKRPKTVVKNEVIELLSSDDESPKARKGKSKAVEVIELLSSSPPDPVELKTSIEVAKREVIAIEDRDEDVADGDDDDLSPLRLFLQSSMLSTDTSKDEDDKKVTISTVHSAKGLEWPVVFIPAVEQGTYPSARCIEEKEVAEERRLLYVAMTRAQCFLTLTYTMQRMLAGETKTRNLSEFADKSLRQNAALFTSVLPPIDAAVRKQMAKMIGRAVRDEKRTAALIAAHLRTAEPLSTWDAPSADEQDRLREERSHSFSTRFGSGFGGFGAFGAFNGKSRERERDVEDGRPGFLAFSSAKSLVNTTSAPAKPVVRLQSSVRHLHALANAPTPVTQATNLMSFTSSSNSSLAAMKALGLPGPEAGTSVGARAGAGTGAGSGVGLGAARAGTRPTGFTVPSATVSAAGTTTTSGTSATANAASAPLARGTKRLGMGRPAPWGSKRT